MTPTAPMTRPRRLATAALTLALLAGSTARAGDDARAAKADKPTILFSVSRFLMGSSQNLVLLSDGRAYSRSDGAPFKARGVRMGRLDAKTLAALCEEIRESGLLDARFKQLDDPMLLSDGGRRLLIQLEGKSRSLAPPRVAELNAASKALSARISALIKSLSASLEGALKSVKGPALAPWLAAMIESGDLPSQSAALSDLRSIGPDGAGAAEAVKALGRRATSAAKQAKTREEKAKFAYLVRFAEVTLKDITPKPRAR